jgi:hypothetical protein
MSRIFPTVSSVSSVNNAADSSPDAINPLFIIPETNQLSADLFPKTVPISPDFHQLIDDKMIVDDGTNGSYELYGGGINYKEKYMKYKQKYIQLKTEFGGGNVPINEQNIYTNIYYSNNGDLNKIKEFFLETSNKHYVKEIINYISKIDTYIFNNFKKEEKIIFWIAMNDEYIDSKNKEDNTRLHKIKNVAYQFKRLYDNWHTYPKKEIENLEIIKDLSYYFDSI